jgi:UPF0755 protein
MRKAAWVVFLLVIIGLAGVVWYAFNVPNINGVKRAWVKIPTGSTFDDVVKLLHDNEVLKNEATFEILSRFKNYPAQIKAGYYVFNRNMDNRQIVNLLKSGKQTPVTLVIYNIRTKEEFAGLIGRTLEIDSNALLKDLDDPDFCKQFGLDTNNILSRFIVDNYEFYWNTPIPRFLEKMDTVYNKFWNTERKNKAADIHLSPTEVTTLASIVEKEVIRDKELPTVAGVYLNRLKINMKLQADPPLIFALRDFDARRVNQRHKEHDSPYNTYMYVGLPPGPICMPRKKSIDAVLNPEEHDFLYFCANPDMSGYSIFSKTNDDQSKVAGMLHKKLDKLNVH